MNQLFDLCAHALGFCRKYRSTVAVVISDVAVLVEGARVLHASRRRLGAIGFALFVCLTLSANAAFATTYYVDASNPNGRGDGNSCVAAQTISSPKLTITGGVSCMNGGDTLYVRGGTYHEALNRNTSPSGTGTSWPGATTIKAYPGETPTMIGNVWISVKSYIVWDGISINGINNPHPTADGDQEDETNIFINGGDHILFTNAEVYNCQKLCILTDDGNGPLSNIEFTYLKVHDSGFGAYTSAVEPANHNFYITAHYTTTGPILIDHVESYNAKGPGPNSWGIQVYSSDPGFLNGVVISNSYIHDNNQGIVVGSGPNHKVFNNVLYNNDLAGSYAEAAITVGYGTGLNNIQVYNNTIVHNQYAGAYGISVGTYSAPTNTIIKNNILWQNGNDSILLAGGKGTATANNFMARDPLFVNPSTLDFHLQSSSAARNTGVNLSSIFTTDKDGNIRPATGNWDAGAYVAVAGGSTPPPPAPPVAAFTYSPSAPVTGSPVFFDGSSSNCAATPCSYTWTDDADGSTLGTGVQMSFTFQSGGTKFVRLTMVDARSQSASVEHNVDVSWSTTSSSGSAPSIVGFTPPSGSVGTSVTISGTNFTGASAVKFNGVAAAFTVVSSTSIQTSVPSGASTGPLSVTTSAGTASSTTAFPVSTSTPPGHSKKPPHTP